MLKLISVIFCPHLHERVDVGVVTAHWSGFSFAVWHKTRDESVRPLSSHRSSCVAARAARTAQPLLRRLLSFEEPRMCRREA